MEFHPTTQELFCDALCCEHWLKKNTMEEIDPHIKETGYPQVVTKSQLDN